MQYGITMGLAAVIGLAGAASGQRLETYTFDAVVTEVVDPLGAFDTVSVGGAVTGSFQIDLDAVAQLIGINVNDLPADINYFLTPGLTATAGGQQYTTLPGAAVVFNDFVGQIEQPNPTNPGPFDTLFIGGVVDGTPDDTYSSVELILEGQTSWYATSADLPAIRTLGLENLLRAEVIIELQVFSGTIDPNDLPGSNIEVTTSQVRASLRWIDNGGRIATIGCRVAEFAQPPAVANVFDIFAFFSAFGTNNPSADITGEGSLNVFDIFAFFSAFGSC